MRFALILFAVCIIFGIQVNAQNLTSVWEFQSGIFGIELGYDIRSCFVNSDTITDIVVTGNGTFWVLYGQEEEYPYFGTVEMVTIPNANFLSVECDFFSYPEFDIIIGDPTQNLLYSYQHNGTSVERRNTYDILLNSDPTGRSEFGYKLHTADVDGDTTPDLIVSDPGAQVVSVFYSDGGSAFSQLTTVPWPSAGLGSRFGEEFFVADVIGTNAVDLVVSAPLYDTINATDVGVVVIFEGFGTGLFAFGNPIEGGNPEDHLGALMAATERYPNSGQTDTVLTMNDQQIYFIPPPLSNITDFSPQNEGYNISALGFVDNFMNSDLRRELAVGTVYEGDGFDTYLTVYASEDLPQDSFNSPLSWPAGGHIIHKVVELDNKSQYSSALIAVTQRHYNDSQGRVVVLQTTAAVLASPSTTPTGTVPSPSPFTTPTGTVPSPSSSTPNPTTSGNDSSSNNNGSDTTVIVASTVTGGGSCMIIIVVAMIFWIRKKKKQEDSDDEESDTDF